MTPRKNRQARPDERDSALEARVDLLTANADAILPADTFYMLIIGRTVAPGTLDFRSNVRPESFAKLADQLEALAQRLRDEGLAGTAHLHDAPERPQ